MGLSVSASVAVLFTAVILSTIVLYGTIENSLDQFHRARDYQWEFEETRLHARVEIVSIEELGGGDHLVTVENTGDVQLRARDGEGPAFEFLVGGYLSTSKVDNSSIRVEGRATTSIFNPDEEMSFVLRQTQVEEGEELKIVFYEPCFDYYTYT